MTDKRCSTCHEVKAFSEFNRWRRSQDGHQARCRSCCQAWYADNAVQHRSQVAARKKRVRAEYRLRLGQYLQGHPCVDCGEADLRVLEFDHRPGVDKLGAIANLIMSQAPWHRILAEIDKCDVRCANCHRRRTAERGWQWRQVLHAAAGVVPAPGADAERHADRAAR